MVTSLRDAFRHHHRLSDEERSQLWQSCVFAFDTNCLLNIYRYADSTRDDLFRVLENLPGRIWVPYQAAKEFYKNRIGVIKEQKAKYDDLEAELDKASNSLRDGKFRKSAFLGIEDLEAALKPAIEQARSQITQRRSAHPDLLHDDPFLERLVSIVGASFGTEPTPDCFAALCKQAQERIDKQQPPGYADGKKPEPDRFGDVLIWFELLEYAKTGGKPLILVTDDEKEDWWQIVAGEKLGPRPELREEMRKVAGVEFQLANPAYFLKQAADQVKVKVAPSSVNDAQQVAAEIRLHWRNPEQIDIPAAVHERPLDSRQMSAFVTEARRAVGRWVLSHCGTNGYVQAVRGTSIDFIVSLDRNRTVGIKVYTARHLPMGGMLFSRIRELFLRAHYEISEGRYDDFAIVVVAETESVARGYIDSFSNRRPHIEPRFAISIGTLFEDHGYEELARFEDSTSSIFRYQSSLHLTETSASSQISADQSIRPEQK